MKRFRQIKRFIFFVCCMLTLPVCNNAVAFTLPDTGQTLCYDSLGNVIGCAGTGQDGAYTINPMSFTDNGDGTVTDNNTRLMWQKEDDGNTYNWYQASGTFDATYNPSSQNVCGSLTIGGHSDWRLPAKKELMSIVDYGIPYPGPTIDTTYFQNTNPYQYWSSTTSAYNPFTACAYNPFYAWDVAFSYGSVYYGHKGYSYYVRCARGGQPAQEFADNGNGTVTDNKTGLIWQQGEMACMPWNLALSYCEGLSLGGHSDWRLPNIKELESITDDTRCNPAIDTAYFPNAYWSYYWSSTTDAHYPGYAWVAIFADGGVGGYDRSSSSGCVRCVRGGQSGSFDTTPPTTTASPPGGTYASAQSVTLGCTDDSGSGCQTTYYCIGSGCNPAIVYSGSINISSSTTLRFYSTDNANNSESVKAETYTITINPSTLTLLVPNGGDILPSGGTYAICWEAPLSAVKFDLLYTTNGTDWISINTVTGLNCTHWEIPVVTVNKKTCRVKVIGYDSNSVKVGEDISDKPFTIEVARVTSPNGGETLKSGNTWTIRWVTNKTVRPVAKTLLKYTTDGGATWKAIITRNSNIGNYPWTVPYVTSTRCKVKVILKDATNVTVGSDVSDKVFTIEP